MTPSRRLYRLRPLAAVFLCLPWVLLCAWYAWKAYSSLDSYRRAFGEDAALTLEDFQLSLHDAIERDLRRMTMLSAPSSGRIERFVFHMKPEAVDAIYSDRYSASDRHWVKADLQVGSELKQVELRLRGGKHWNELGVQRSLKIKLDSGDLYDGHRVFNLINDPSPLVVGEEIILDLARDHGVLTPRSEFARVFLNGADLGVMRYETQPDEGLLRLRRRMPGSIYSSNLPSSAPTDALWKDRANWTKPAWRDEATKEDFSEIELLLDRVDKATVRQFADFARSEIDLDAFATHNALDIAFGGDQHDFRDNHKLYYDPYRGRFEPIAWNFRGYKHEENLNLVENPILLRLEMVPEFLSMRAAKLHELLVGEARVAAIERRGRRLLKRLEPELASDPHFDAYKLLPGVDRFHRQMLRPMNMTRAVMILRSELATYAARHAYLLREIRANPLWIRVGAHGLEPAVAAEGGCDEGARPTYRTPVDLIVDGHAGVSLTEIAIAWKEDCAAPTWRLLRAGEPVEADTRDTGAVLAHPLAMHPRVAFEAKGERADVPEALRAVRAPAVHPFELVSSCEPGEVSAWGVHMATGSRIRARLATEAVLARVPAGALAPDDVPDFVDGEVSSDPWRLATPPPAHVTLGPGDVDISTTRIFDANQTVRIEPGTNLRMGEGASLVFLGRVEFAGTDAAPIIVEPSGASSFGGIAVQGPGTAGSSFTHVFVRGGTHPAWRIIPYPGMLDIHDTRDITIRHCAFGRNSGSDDVLHIAYVEAILIEDCVVEASAADAIDMEFSAGMLRRVSFFDSGDDGLDLMGSDVDLVDSVVMGCAGNAVSAGEETTVMVRDSLLAACKVGLLAKNASTATLAGALLFENGTGVRVYRKEKRYSGGSLVEADALYAVECGEPIRLDEDSSDALAVGRIERRAPRDGSLDHLMEDVLEIASFEDLEVRVAPHTKARKR